MLTGMLDASVVTAKEFMLTPNMPRFVRVGDKTPVSYTHLVIVLGIYGSLHLVLANRTKK